MCLEFGENYGSEILKYLNLLKHKFNKFISTAYIESHRESSGEETTF